MSRFGTVLVANRGEIALRVIRSAAEHGLTSVAVYSDADSGSVHVREADVAVRIGPAAAASSYLSISALLEAARLTGADAVHPGYGFLSERATFAQAVIEAGLVFIGPPAGVMDAMGRKDRARDIAAAAGVPVMPAAVSATDLDDVAREVGYPLLVKAAAGGGGKGMRIVRSANDLADAVAAARREAAAAFGDDTMLFERYVEHGRHVEVQILADEHGNVVHLHERDCSVQRRHQKVVEEAPATVISPEVRELVTSSAVALAREVGYVNAGTVEFLVTGEEAYFLEMNTRLQVEHPVTEMVTGLDLVGLQFSIAQGDQLPFDQSDVAVRGHAIEARVYAEDPFSGFLPQAGVAEVVRWPTHARVDAALESGQRVGTSYDPMLGKVIASGASREAARRALVSALDDTAILGLTTNVGFVRQLVASAAFRDSGIDTGWLDAHPEEFALATPVPAWCLAAWSVAAASTADPSQPFGVGDGWRLGAPPGAVPIVLTAHEGDTRLLSVDLAAGVIAGPHSARDVTSLGETDGLVRLQIGSEVHGGRVLLRPHEVLVAYRGQTYAFARPDAFAPGRTAATTTGRISAPMPGTVLAVHVAAGSAVDEGEALAVMEAMKMELALKAPFAGTVTEVNVVAGDLVDLGARLFVVTAAEAS